MTNKDHSSALSSNNNDKSIIPQKDSTTTIRSESIEIRPTRSMTCYICLENILTTQKQIGLQNNCDHIFCFDCLSTWRHTSAINDKDTSGRCPLCRVRSTFIAPSWRCFNDADDKQSLIDAHKLHLKSVPCRVFSRSGYCPFGHRCYYRHNSLFIFPTFQRWPSSSPIDMSYLMRDNQQNSSSDLQWDSIRAVEENNQHDDDEEEEDDVQQQQPPRRITFNAYRYRPY